MPNTKPNKDAEGFGRRLVAMLERRGQPRRGAGAYLSRRYKVSNVVANAWLNGEYKPEIPKAKEIAEDHGDSFNNLYFGGSMEAPTEDGWADIEGYAQAIGLGDGPEAQEYAETHKLKFRAESLARKRLRPPMLKVMYGKGDSMEPRIHSGDAILFDTSDARPRDGALFVIMVDGGGAAKEYQVKRCEVLDDLVFFKADNPAGDHNWKKPKRMDNARHPIEIIGRVRWIGSWEE